MVALSTLQDVNRGLNETQTRVSTGLKISSGKDNAAYFAISMTMKGDSSIFQGINDGLTTTKNSLSTARLGAETVADLAQQFTERMAFAQGSGLDLADVQKELEGFVDRMTAAIDQATFNGSDLINGTAAVTVVTGVSRSSGSFATTTVSFNQVDVGAIRDAFAAIDVTGMDAAALATALGTSETQYAAAVTASTDLGVAEKTIEGQQMFLDNLIDTLDTGVGAMVDADMEEEAARLQSFQVQQQLAIQSLSIANQGPQNILSLFR
jgi:flagellin